MVDVAAAALATFWRRNWISSYRIPPPTGTRCRNMSLDSSNNPFPFIGNLSVYALPRWYRVTDCWSHWATCTRLHDWGSAKYSRGSKRIQKQQGGHTWKRIHALYFVLYIYTPKQYHMYNMYTKGHIQHSSTSGKSNTSRCCSKKWVTTPTIKWVLYCFVMQTTWLATGM